MNHHFSLQGQFQQEKMDNTAMFICETRFFIEKASL